MTPDELALLADFAGSYPRFGCVLLLVALGHKMPAKDVQWALVVLGRFVEGCRSGDPDGALCEAAY